MPKAARKTDIPPGMTLRQDPRAESRPDESGNLMMGVGKWLTTRNRAGAHASRGFESNSLRCFSDRTLG